VGELNASLPGDDVFLPDDCLPDDVGPHEPGLDQLLGLLTAGPAPGELAGESAALAMFLASRPPAAGVPSRPRAAGVERWRASRQRRGLARWLAAGVTVALTGGFAAAAYAEALPAPVQHVAYRMLGFVGVPDVHHGPPSAGSHHVRPAPTGRVSPVSGSPVRSSPPSSASPPSSTATPRPSPSTSAGAALVTASVTVAHSRIVAGQGVVLVGQLANHGRAMRYARLSLFERTAGEPAWHLARVATTGADGRAVLTVLDLTTNALFRLSGPDGARSRPVLVIVVPPVSVSVSSGPRGQLATLTASSPLAARGDVVVLQRWTGGRWLSVRARRLDGAGRAPFLVRSRARRRAYRVVLLATAAHGRSVSDPLTVAAP
jgi:hypothetical protein